MKVDELKKLTIEKSVTFEQIFERCKEEAEHGVADVPLFCHVSDSVIRQIIESGLFITKAKTEIGRECYIVSWI